MRTREQEVEPLINLSEITEVELLILKRMREFTPGEHSSLFHGAGFNFVGLRDWQAGDRFETIDWPQSSLTNFSPLIIREFEQPSTSSVIMVADRSLSTRCGIDGVPIATTIARTLATIGMSAEAARACSSASIVCGITPSSAATTRTTMSVQLAPRARSSVNARWPGVSRKVTLWPSLVGTE